jgi:hypothetical protein
MKDLKTIREDIVVEEEKSDYSKFDTLVRAGLANKAQLQRIHKILDKMQEPNPQFSSADRAIVVNIFNRMVDVLSNNKQVFSLARKAVKEEEEIENSISTESIDEAYARPVDPPPVLVLKRKAIRVFPNRTRVALYFNDKIGRYFSVPYSTPDEFNKFDSTAQMAGMQAIATEEVIYESHGSAFDALKKIVDDKQHQKVKFDDGSSATVDGFTASAIMAVHKALNDDNKKKIEDLVNKSKAGMMKASSFAFKQMK